MEVPESIGVVFEGDLPELVSPKDRILHLIGTSSAEGANFRKKLFTLAAQFSATPAAIEAPPPKLSQHTCEVLRELGYAEQDTVRLREIGAV